MTSKEIINEIYSDKFETVLVNELAVPKNYTEAERARIAEAVREFCRLYGHGRDMHLFSVGGRSEISGNHTDHNAGKVIAASVNLSIIAVAAVRDDGTVRLKSEGFDEDIVYPEQTISPDSKLFGKSSALIAGCERAFLNAGLKIGGFDAYTVSNVFKGSGLSSSAAFEVAVCKMLSYFFNDDKISAIDLAKMSRYAENEFFGKPCGLMDQAACASGGFITVDFKDESAPVIEKLDFDLADAGYSLCITDTGGNHADLTPEYAAIPAEMKDVADFFGKKVLRETDRQTVVEHAASLRASLGDRPLLRALHFFDENERVRAQVEAIKENNIEQFFSLVRKSGLSSFCYLQNVFPPGISEQGVASALYFSNDYFAKNNIKGVCRVHGGGFAGTAQAFVPSGDAEGYKKYMEALFGTGRCHILSVRKAGAVCLM